MVGVLRYLPISSITSPHLPRIYRVKFYLTQVSRCRNLAIRRRFTHVEPIRITRIFPVSIQFPATEKHTETGKNVRFAYALSEMQGWRLSESQYLFCFLCLACSPHPPFNLVHFVFVFWRNPFLKSSSHPFCDILISHLLAAMEDAHAISLNLDEHPDEAESNTFFAVYDGHGGTETLFRLSFGSERVEHRQLCRTICRPKCA